MKMWMWIVLAVAFFAFAAYKVVSKGGVLEMQPEHAAETQHSAPSATAAPKK
jgi:hypothetical protein